MATVLALAGAGLTLALKDFIVGFFGWFVLMGRNGIRLGDWVEINGVRGEVVEIDLLHTVLLETGNWTDGWHPTGRHVSFVNSYAIEGHYFNFSTSGQWLWDELQVLVPSGEDPKAVAEEIQQIVSSDTEANANLAEQEWQKTTSAKRMHTFKGTPGVSVRPTAAGIEGHGSLHHTRHGTRRSARSLIPSCSRTAAAETIAATDDGGADSGAMTEGFNVNSGSSDDSHIRDSVSTRALQEDRQSYCVQGAYAGL